MDLMSAQLARLMIEARLAEADERRLGNQIRAQRRDERRQRRRIALDALDAWRRRLAPRRTGSGQRTLAAVVAAPPVPPSVEVARLLDAAAHRVAEHGTASERTLLDALSEVAAPRAPGAAAALVDAAGTETSRLRAFGLVHTLVLEELGPREHVRLLDLVHGRGRLATPERVA